MWKRLPQYGVVGALPRGWVGTREESVAAGGEGWTGDVLQEGPEGTSHGLVTPSVSEGKRNKVCQRYSSVKSCQR